MASHRPPHQHNIPSALNAELQRYQMTYAELNRRHAILDASLLYSPEGTGIIFEMIRVEKEMSVWRKKIADALEILNEMGSKTNSAPEAR